MPDTTPMDAFEHLLGERLTIDMQEVQIVQVTSDHRKRTRQVNLVVSARDRPVRGREYAILVTCPDDKAAMWVIDQLRRRELHNGCVWFLAGTTMAGATIKRGCEVPAGTALFFPVVNQFYCSVPSLDPPETLSEAYVRSQLSFVSGAANNLVATIDGVAVPNIKPGYFEQSSLFSVVLPAENLFGLPPNTLLDPCADAGYYLMLHPMSIGEHTIAFSGSLGDFTIDVEYTITVVTRKA